MKKQLLRFALIHGAFLGFLGVILGARYVSRVLGISLPVCLLHDVFGLYCPFCGGTRAVGALLAGNLMGALRANAAVVLSLPLLIWADARALVRILGKKSVSPLLPFHPLIPIVLFAAFFILRNVLLLFGIDPTGDFLEQLKNIK